MELSADYVKYQPENNPEAIIKYSSDEVNIGRIKNPHVKDTILKAKKHLALLGWSFFYIHKNHGKRELRYRSPEGRTYYSLRTACQHAVQSQNPKKPEKTYDYSLSNSQPKKKTKRIRVEEKDSCQHAVPTQNPKEPESKPEKINYSLSNFNRPKKKIRLEDVEDSYFQQQKDRFFIENNEDKEIGDSRVEEVDIVTKTCGKRNYFKPNKLIRKMPDPGSRSCSSAHVRRCILSLLIKESIILPGSRVSYCKKDGRVLAKGRVYDSGIQCDCCDQFFLLSKFEAHAGSTIRRPAANIFLDDGRSIFDCQTLLQHHNKAVNVTKTIKSTKSFKPIPNDDFCAFCNDGGELVLCDSCTSSFHLTCIGLSLIPDSDYWFCPSCCCGLCHEGDRNNDSDSDQIKCGQCERKFHIECLKKLGFLITGSGHDKWLCSEDCERISSGLKMLTRETIIPSTNNLSWRILKLEKDEFDTFDYTDTYSKLKVALDVMHECFQPIKHSWSDNDLVEDLVFGRSSTRSNLKGFFTAVLERDDEMITVATLRVHGGKVAEMPLVATRFQYRRLGMCRVLMDEIERKLGDLGVERLVLPAVPEMISTWTTSFGFKVMTEDERVELVEYKFVDFPGTVRCHKMLR